MASQANSTKPTKNFTHTLKLFHKIEDEGTLPKSYKEATVTDSKIEKKKNKTSKKTITGNIFDEYAKNLNKIVLTGNLHWKKYVKNNNTPWPSVIHPKFTRITQNSLET